MSAFGEKPRDLVFLVLGLQADLIDSTALADAMREGEAEGTLGALLVERGGLREPERELLEALTEIYVLRHGNDAAASLAALSAGPSTRERLAKLGDPALTATLARLAETLPALGAELADTVSFSIGDAAFGVGAATSAGQRFRVLRPHAKGGLGEVFVALDEELHREVALKEIQARHADDPASRQRFLVEAEITGGLEHPGIVPVYGLGAYANGRPFYAMRFIKGDSLKDAAAAFHADPKLKTDPGARGLALQKLLRRFLDVCNAIDYAHSRGVLHRDLKPGNVMVGLHGETFVVDWGLAKTLGRVGDDPVEGEPPLVPASSGGSAETFPGSAVGTPGYMSPEQAAGDLARLGPATDVYGLGATLYVVLTGRAAFPGKDVPTILEAVANGNFPTPKAIAPALAPALNAVCLKAMALRPEDRYPTARALADDLERWIADEPVSAYQEPRPARLARWARHHKSAVAATAALLVSAVVALTLATALVWGEQRKTARQKAYALREWNRAEANLDISRALTFDILDKFETRLAAVRGTEGVRRDLLDSALKSFQQFHAQRPNDPELAKRTATLYRYSANLHRLLNETETAERSYRESVKILDTLATRFPDDRLYRMLLSETHRDFASVYQKVGRFAEAATELTLSATLAESLLAASPGDAKAMRTLGTTLADLATLNLLQGRFDDAKRSSQKAVTLLSALPGPPSKEANSLDPLLVALARHDLGYAHRELGETDEALKVLADAIALLRPAVEQRTDPNALHVYAKLLVGHSRAALLVESRRPRAEKDLEQAILLWQELRNRNPLIALYRDWLAVAYLIRGDVRAALDKPGPANADLEESRTILEALVKEFPAIPGYRGNLGRTYASLSRLSTARNDLDSAREWRRQARAALAEAVRISPQNGIDRRSLEEISKGE